MNNIINHAKEDGDDLFLRLHLEFKKMHYILMHCSILQDIFVFFWHENHAAV